MVIPLAFKSIPIFSGWNRLAEKYAISEEVKGTLFSNESAMMVNQFSYNGVLRFVVNNDGLGISTSSFFKSGHPKLFIPWSNITARRENILFRKFIRLTVGNVDCPIRISEGLIKGINQTLKSLDLESIAYE